MRLQGCAKVWSCTNPHAARRPQSDGLFFCKASKRTVESYNAVKGILHLALCRLLQASCDAYASLCSDRCNRQSASLLQALARPRLVSSDACNAAPSGPLSK